MSLTKGQLQIIVSKQNTSKFGFYCVYWSYCGKYFSQVVQATSKSDAQLKLIDAGIIDEKMAIDGFKFII